MVANRVVELMIEHFMEYNLNSCVFFLQLMYKTYKFFANINLY